MPGQHIHPGYATDGQVYLYHSRIIDDTFYGWIHLALYLQAIKDWHLIVFVAVLAAVDIVILTVATAIPTARLKAKLEPNEENKFDETGVRMFAENN